MNNNAKDAQVIRAGLQKLHNSDPRLLELFADWAKDVIELYKLDPQAAKQHVREQVTRLQAVKQQLGI